MAGSVHNPRRPVIPSQIMLAGPGASEAPSASGRVHMGAIPYSSAHAGAMSLPRMAPRSNGGTR